MMTNTQSCHTSWPLKFSELSTLRVEDLYYNFPYFSKIVTHPTLLRYLCIFCSTWLAVSSPRRTDRMTLLSSLHSSRNTRIGPFFTTSLTRQIIKWTILQSESKQCVCTISMKSDHLLQHLMWTLNSSLNELWTSNLYSWVPEPIRSQVSKMIHLHLFTFDGTFLLGVDAMEFRNDRVYKKSTII